MKSYLLSLLVTSLLLSVIGIIVPKGEREGLAKHMRLVCALVWLCILISPLLTLISDWQVFWDGLDASFSEDQAFDGYREQFDLALEESSRDYFCDMLTQTLEEHFEITPGDLRCRIQWAQSETGASPTRVTLLLSGKAIWKSPTEMEAFVSELLGCECVSAIE